MSTYDQSAYAGAAVTRNRRERCSARSMGRVAVTVGFSALGAYLGRNLCRAGTGLLFFIAAFACIFGLNIANSRGREQLAVALLLALGLALGLTVAPVIAAYANADPAALWQAWRRGRGIHRRRRRVRLRHAAGPVRVGQNAVLGAARVDRVRPGDDLRLDPARQRHLRRARPGDLRRFHDHRLQPPAPRERDQCRADRSRHLPRHLQRVPAFLQIFGSGRD